MNRRKVVLGVLLALAVPSTFSAVEGLVDTTTGASVDPATQAELNTHTGAASPHSGHLSNVVEDTTPQLGGDLDVDGNAIKNAVNHGDIIFDTIGSGDFVFNNDATQILEMDSNGHMDLDIKSSGYALSIFSAYSTGINVTIVSDAGTSIIGHTLDVADDSASVATIAEIAGVFGHAYHWGTGVATKVAGLEFKASSLGNGDITALYGILVTSDTDGGSGTKTDSYGGRILHDSDSNTTNDFGLSVEPYSSPAATNVYGLRVGDHAGLGSSISYNMLSEGATSLNIFEGSVSVDVINEETAAAGVTIDTVLIKDGNVDGVDISGITSFPGFTDLDTDYGNETIVSDYNFATGTLEIPNSVTLPGTCSDGELYFDTDATSGSRLYGCESGSFVAQVGTGFPGFTDIDTDYGNETVTSDFIFQGASSSGGKGAWDLSAGNGSNYGGLRIGDSGWYRSSYSSVNLDLDGAMVIWNEGNLGAGNDPGIELAIMEDSNSLRLAVPESGSGNATAMIRSVTVAGPYTSTVGNDVVLCSQWSNYDSNIDCDTGGTGADLFVQDDFEVEGEIFASGTIHLDADDANQLTLGAASQTASHAWTWPDDELAAGDLILGGASGAFTYGKISALTEETAPVAGDWLLGEESGGAMRKFDVGDLPEKDVIWLAVTNNVSSLTTGTAKLSKILPQAFQIDTGTDSGVGCSVITAPTTSGITVDMNEAGSTIMTTNKVDIDATENNSQNAGTAPTVTDSALAKGARITIDIDAIGSGTAGVGLTCWLIGEWQ